MQDRVELDSAGTGSWHVGSAPDARARAAASGRGVELTGEARQVRPEDFERVRPDPRDGPRQPARPARAGGPERASREGAPAARVRPGERRRAGGLDVPDPYYGAGGGFEEVFDLVDAACRGLLDEIRAGRVP